MELWLDNFLGKGQIYSSKSSMYTAKLAVDFPQNVTFFVSVTLSRMVKIFKKRYRWKDLSLLTLLLTNLLT